MVAVFVAFLALYAWTAAPGILYGDSGEMQTAALVGGVPHATGYPAFLLFGRLFSKIPWPDPAFRITFMSSFFGAASLVLLIGVLFELGVAPLAACAGVAIYGLSFTFWRVSLRAEVYTVGIFLALLGIWRTLAAIRAGSLWSYLVAAFLLGATLTGHLTFLLPVAAMGIALAWFGVRKFKRPIVVLALLAGAFALGLTPYLYLVWLDLHNHTMNYYDLVMLAKNPRGLPVPDFDTPWKHLVWMLTGRNMYPPVPFHFDVRSTCISLMHSVAILWLFEFGPVTLPFALWGWTRLMRQARAAAVLLTILFLVSVAFSAALQGGAMLHIFLIPALIVTAVFIAVGIDAAFEHWGASHHTPVAATWVAGAALVALVVIPDQWIRIYTAAHPIGRWGFHVEEEGTTARPTLFPSMSAYRDPERFAKQAIAAIPQNALVAAEWSEFNALRYSQLVLGERPDLTLQTATSETRPLRIELWQKANDITRRPVVFIPWNPGLGPRAAPLDSVPLGPDQWMYVLTHPLELAGSP